MNNAQPRAKLLLRTIRSFAIGFALFVASFFSVALKPVAHMSSTPFDLAAAVPEAFGNWQPDPSPLAIDPVSAAAADKVYVQTLARSYVDSQGNRVMLSVAYGTEQIGDGVQAHRPEYCYKAQGFGISTVTDTTLETRDGSIPVRRLLATRDQRVEPVSYWMTIGDEALLPGLSRKLVQLRHGLAGNAPDGLLIRVSSIERDPAATYALHDRFVRDLLEAVPPAQRARLSGYMAAGTALPPTPHVQDVAAR